MSGPYNPRWKKKPENKSPYESILGKSGRKSQAFGGRGKSAELKKALDEFNEKVNGLKQDRVHIVTGIDLSTADLLRGVEEQVRMRPDLYNKIRDELKAKIEADMQRTFFGGTQGDSISAEEIYAKMSEHTRRWREQYETNPWSDEPRGKRNPSNVHGVSVEEAGYVHEHRSAQGDYWYPHALEGEYLPAKREAYEPKRKVHSQLVAKGCRITYRGVSLTLSDDERKSRRAQTLKGTIGMFCRIIDNSRRIAR
jgi:hypothetical protein